MPENYADSAGPTPERLRHAGGVFHRRRSRPILSQDHDAGRRAREGADAPETFPPSNTRPSENTRSIGSLAAYRVDI